MELTSQSFEEVTFGAKKLGYDPTEVDEFLSAGKEYIAELEDRLRRVTERAARAEQQLDSGSSGLGAAEIGKVWERAAAAAEAAVDEARTEAQRILADARYHSDMQLGDARRQAETIVEQAHEEALRISAEAQSQLRAEVSQLEQTREALRGDVNALTSYSDQQLDRVRTTLTDALASIEAHASGEAAPPEVVEALGPPPAQPVAEPASEGTYNPSYEAAAAPVDPWATPDTGNEQYGSNEWGSDTTSDEQEWANASSDNGYNSFSSQDQDNYSNEDEYASGTNYAAAESYNNNEGYGNDYGNEQQGSYSAGNDQYGNEAEEESDPFLAELRRAVQDDGPLGPRDNGANQDEDVNSINRLYSPEDDTDDRSGFFRRKK